MKKYLENNCNFYDFSLKSAHFLNINRILNINGLANCNFDVKFEISDMNLLNFNNLSFFFDNKSFWFKKNIKISSVTSDQFKLHLLTNKVTIFCDNHTKIRIYI